MNSPQVESSAELRRLVYLLLIVVSAGSMLGRILSLDSVDKFAMEDYRLKKVAASLEAKRASLKAEGVSDAAIASQLGELEAKWTAQAKLRRPFLSANDRSRWCTVRALVEDDMRVAGAPYAIDKVVQQANWDTIDMVKCQGHFYSSKPPLLPTVMAGVYWPIHKLTGATLGTHPYEIGRFLLVVFNLVPLVVYFLLLAALIERFGTTDWGRIFVMAAATWGTFLTTFAVTINNHILAAVFAVAAVYATARIWFDGERRWRFYFLAGLCGGLMTVNEFTALSLLALLGAALTWKSAGRAVIGAGTGVLLVAVFFFATNWIAFHSLKPAYLHRSGNDNWYDYSYERNGRTVDSYWRKPQGIDRGEPCWATYATHVLIGHHGLFSLTPIWLLSAFGMGMWLRRGVDKRLRWAAAGVAAVSLACLVFYLGQPPINRNYGGTTSGLRWLFWLAPLWLVTMLPALDGCAARRGLRGLALTLLGISVVSVTYPTWNPWTHPWLMNFWNYLNGGA